VVAARPGREPPRFCGSSPTPPQARTRDQVREPRGSIMRVKLLIAVVVAVVVSFVAVGAATALPLTQSRPFQAVCGAQGGSFFAASSSLIFCEKHGSFAAFTPTQLAVQQTLCERSTERHSTFFPSPIRLVRLTPSQSARLPDPATRELFCFPGDYRAVGPESHTT
jgi:hypothetical protein